MNRHMHILSRTGNKSFHSWRERIPKGRKKDAWEMKDFKGSRENTIETTKKKMNWWKDIYIYERERERYVKYETVKTHDLVSQLQSSGELIFRSSDGRNTIIPDDSNRETLRREFLPDLHFNFIYFLTIGIYCIIHLQNCALGTMKLLQFKDAFSIVLYIIHTSFIRDHGTLFF